MANDHSDLLDHLTFSQRHGYEPLPEPMKLEELSDDLRREIWNEVRELLLSKRSSDLYDEPCFVGEEERFVERVVGKFTKTAASEVSTAYHNVVKNFHYICVGESFNLVLDFLEIIVNDRKEQGEFHNIVESLFETHSAAYTLDVSRRPYRFVPRASKEQGEATQQAVETVEQSGVTPGAATHLRQAVEHLNAGRYADSIRESIHAVESVARVVDPEANKTLGPALKSLERAGLLHHPALREAFDSLYGYINDEQGVRHALIERDAADVDVDDALFMYGACASFAAYLVNKHQEAEGT